MNTPRAITFGLVVATVPVGCKDSPPPDAADCAQVLAVVDAVPRRYRHYKLTDEERAQLDIRDKTLRTALRDANVTYERLADICAPRTADAARERDCAEVRSILAGPFALPERGVHDQIAIFDPGPLQALKAHTYHDPEVRDAALAVARDAPGLFSAKMSDADWSSIDRLTKLCKRPSTK